MQDRMLHPLTSSSFSNLVRLGMSYGFEPKYLPRLLTIALLSALRRPVAWLESAKYGRAIHQQAIEPDPIFIIGHWRSGTTYLQNLMSRDSRFARVTLLQAAMPHEFLMFPDTLIAKMRAMLPKTRLMDNMAVSADAPWEEEMALVSSSRLSFYHVSFFPRVIEKIFRDAILFDSGDQDLIRQWEREYLYFLKKVQFVQPGQRLLLKNPANTARIPILKRLFPRAKFIHIHRDPYKVFSSTVHLYLKAQEAWGLHRVDRDHVVRHVLESYPLLMNAYFAQRKLLGDEELVDVAFRDLQQDPMRTLEAIYRGLNLEGYDSAAPAFARHVESQRNYRKNELTLSPWERTQVRHRWARAFDELGYADDPVTRTHVNKLAAQTPPAA